MKVEKIYSGKVKVTVFNEDLLKHGTTIAQVREKEPTSSAIFWDALHQAQKEVGFDMGEGKLAVEFIQEKGNLVIYITRIDGFSSDGQPFPIVNGTPEDWNEFVKNAKKPKIKLRLSGERCDEKAIIFADFEDVISLATNERMLFGGELYSYNDEYACIFSNAEYDSVIAEYGKPASLSHSVMIIREHGKKICSDAMQTLREQF